MSAVSRSTFQKLVEENKRLKKDIETLVMGQGKKQHDCILKWRKEFIKERDFNNIMYEVAKKYVNEHPEAFAFLNKK